MTRHGECNHCGHCCEMFARNVVVRTEADIAHDPAFYQARGLQEMSIDGARRWVLFGWMAAPCPQHQDGRCAIDRRKPQTCVDFPREPREIVETPCSYWFADGDVLLGGSGSPHPSTMADLLAWEQRA